MDLREYEQHKFAIAEVLRQASLALPDQRSGCRDRRRGCARRRDVFGGKRDPGSAGRTYSSSTNEPPTENEVRNAIERVTVSEARIEIVLNESIVVEGQQWSVLGLQEPIQSQTEIGRSTSAQSTHANLPACST
jgi:hypothetical protein